LALKRAQTAAARLAALLAKRAYRERIEERAARQLMERLDRRRAL
jgi:hypothetical protein